VSLLKSVSLRYRRAVGEFADVCTRDKDFSPAPVIDQHTHFVVIAQLIESAYAFLRALCY
jgi:hypothetical protein